MEENKFEGFTLSMALVDCLPVLFFAVAGIAINVKLESILIGIGVACCLIGGLGKVAWKLVLAFKKKDIQILFKQMRVMMPLGFLLIIAGIIANNKKIQWSLVLSKAIGFPCIIFILLGVVAISGMIYFAKHLDPNDAKSNWIEQGTNCIAQGAFMVAVILICF